VGSSVATGTALLELGLAVALGVAVVVLGLGVGVAVVVLGLGVGFAVPSPVPSAWVRRVSALTGVSWPEMAMVPLLL
jgi:hypothetical protein